MGEPPASLAAAIVALQMRLPAIKKSELAEVQTTKGTYRYTYANLAGISEQILPLLGELGLAFIAKPTFDEGGRFVLAYSLIHVSGEREDGAYPLPTSGTPQAIGSAITYGRRYCLCAVTGVAPEDDDDASLAEQEAAAQRGSAQRAARQQQRPPTAGTGRPSAQRARTAEPGSPPPLPGEGPAGISPAQQRLMHALLRETGRTDRDIGLVFIAGVIDRQIESTKELTGAEARAVIDAMKAETEQGQPDGEDGGAP